MRLGKYLLLGVVLLLTLTGCSSKYYAVLDKSYVPESDIKIEVSSVLNKTNQTYDLDIEKMMRESLDKELTKRDILCSKDNNKKLVFDIEILEYEEGSAFKRWLWPGWGSTVLTVSGDIKAGAKIVGSIHGKRTVDAGGGFTVGAWKRVFDEVAEGIVTDYIKSSSKSRI